MPAEVAAWSRVPPARIVAWIAASWSAESVIILEAPGPRPRLSPPGLYLRLAIEPAGAGDELVDVLSQLGRIVPPRAAEYF